MHRRSRAASSSQQHQITLHTTLALLAQHGHIVPLHANLEGLETHPPLSMPWPNTQHIRVEKHLLLLVVLW